MEYWGMENKHTKLLHVVARQRQLSVHVSDVRE